MDIQLDLINIEVIQSVPYLFFLLPDFFAESQYVLHSHRTGWEGYHCLDGLTS